MMRLFKAYLVRRKLKQTIADTKVFLLSYADVLPVSLRKDIESCLLSAIASSKTWMEYEMEEATNALEILLESALPKKNFALFREYFDVLVVAISVAMAFRAFFYQPFNIPTGSMQPTLYGIHSQVLSAEEFSWTDKEPFATLKWAITGERFKIVKSQASGNIAFFADQVRPGYLSVVVGGVRHFVPSDAIDIKGKVAKLKSGIANGAMVKRGDVLWAGKIISGDFLFVNRWVWNFRRPRRGDVMVFSTNGIEGLAQGTHYIKRMTGLPGETLQILPPNLFVNGKKIFEPLRIKQIAKREAFADGALPYAGFQCAGGVPASGKKTISTVNDTVTLGEDEYYAMGDNAFNSYDSRYWGTVPGKNLRGIAGGVYWPFTSPRWGNVE